MDLTAVDISWFDFVVVIALLVGVSRGRANGMSEEMIPLFQWLTIVVVGALFYEALGWALHEATGLSSTWSNVIGYVAMAGLAKLLFDQLKRATGDKLVQAEVFGRMEYYLGMAAGATRYGCVLLAIMAVLHARHFTPGELAAAKKWQAEAFGEAISFPTWGTLQQAVFEGSASGRFTKTYFSEQLLVPADSRGHGFARPAERRERLVEEAMEGF